MKRVIMILAVFLFMANSYATEKEVLRIVSAQKIRQVNDSTTEMVMDWTPDTGILKLGTFEVELIRTNEYHFVATDSPAFDYGTTKEGIGYKKQLLKCYYKEGDYVVYLAFTIYDDGKNMFTIYLNDTINNYIVEKI
jgi:hypothetical protein